MEEAYLMESKAYGCVDEANAYAKALGLKTRYSIYARDDNHSSKQQFLRTKSSLTDLLSAHKARQETQIAPPPNQHLSSATQDQDFYLTHITEIMKGCGQRLEKMCVEVMGVPGEATQLISLEKFYAEHNKLQLEIRRKRNLMSTGDRKVNIEMERNEINRSGETGGGAMVRRKTLGVGLGGVLDPDELLFLQQSERVGGGGKIKKKSKEARREESAKQVTEEKLIKILEDTREVTRVLEDQLKELKMRGWNVNIL
jgi:hypothetical protein